MFLKGFTLLELIDAIDFDLGQIVTVAVHLLETLATDFLEHQNLIALEVAEDGGLYVCTSDVRFANLNIAVIVFKHHGVKSNLAALIVLKTVHEDLLIFSDLELLSCDFYNCVHFLNMFSLNDLIYFLGLLLPTKRTAKLQLFFKLTKFFLNFFSKQLLLSPLSSFHHTSPDDW